jgi:hypothetical protein
MWSSWIDPCCKPKPIQVPNHETGLAKNLPFYEESEKDDSSCCVPPYWPKNKNMESLDLCETKIPCKDRKHFKSDGCFRNITCYNVDTCLIKYRPRMIVVPSEGIPDIDCAVRFLEQRKGGFVIKLRKGTHVLTKTIYMKTDDLVILGDPCPFIGMAYVEGLMKDPSTPAIDMSYGETLSEMLGKGPFDILVAGNKVTVKGEKDPDFSCIKDQNRLVTFINRDGTLRDAHVIDADKNTLTFDKLDITSGHMLPGQGFFFNPNVTLKLRGNITTILPTNRLQIEGLILDGKQFIIGSVGAFATITRCLLSPESFMMIHGRYYSTGPNTFTGKVYVGNGTIGESRNQSFVGKVARLITDAGAEGAWSYGYFVSCANGCSIVNGSRVNIGENQFINNGIGAFVGFGSTAVVHGCVFLANKWGLMVNYNSVATDVTNQELKDIYPPPVFKKNVYAISASYMGIVVVPKALFLKNDAAAVLDGKIYATSGDVPLGKFGEYLSLIVNTINPFDINPSDTGIVKGDDVPPYAVSSFQGVQGLVGYATKDVITGNLIPGNALNGLIKNKPLCPECIGNPDINFSELVMTSVSSSCTGMNVSGVSVHGPSTVSDSGNVSTVEYSTTGYVP